MIVNLPKKKPILKERNERHNHQTFPPPLYLVWLPPPILQAYNLNKLAVLMEAKATFEQREWPYVGGHVMGVKSMIIAFKKDPF